MTDLYCPSRPSVVPSVSLGIVASATIVNTDSFALSMRSGATVSMAISFAGVNVEAELMGDVAQAITPAVSVDGAIDDLPRAG